MVSVLQTVMIGDTRNSKGVSGDTLLRPSLRTDFLLILRPNVVSILQAVLPGTPETRNGFPVTHYRDLGKRET